MTSCFGIRGLDEQPLRNHKTEGDPLSERRTVLIVDDDVEIREALETYIDGSGSVSYTHLTLPTIYSV